MGKLEVGKIVITGSNGFIGKNLVKHLEGHDIITCDYENADVTPDELLEYLEGQIPALETIIHLGANSSTTETDTKKLKSVNTDFTLSLYQWCTRYNIALIYASSAATYGDGGHGYEDDESLPYLEKLQPLNAYGESKAQADVRIFGNLDPRTSPPVTALKFFNVYGPHESHKGDMRSVARKLYDGIKQEEPAHLFKSYDAEYEDGAQLRDFIYVTDCCEVIKYFLYTPLRGIFNVGSGKARTFKAVAEAVFGALNLAPAITYIDMPSEIQAHYQYFTEANMAKLRSTGYDKPFTSLEEGVKEYVKYLENRL